jgi:hypothetical protein
VAPSEPGDVISSAWLDQLVTTIGKDRSGDRFRFAPPSAHKRRRAFIGLQSGFGPTGDRSESIQIFWSLTAFFAVCDNFSSLENKLELPP